MSKTRLQELSDRGQSVWIDSLSREMMDSGDLERMIREDSVVGVTTNPSIFQKAMASGNAYDDQMREILEREQDGKEVFLQLAITDVRRACDTLRPVWDEARPDGGRDGWVSIEVDPNLAMDADKTLEEAIRLNQAVDRPNAFVKIPATEPGIQAIEDAIARGIAINVTLIFSLERHRQVAEAYLRGLERLIEDGGDPSSIASVASFFVSRVDTEADKRLDEAGRPELKGKLANANAKLAYQHYLEVFAGERWAYLEGKGATKQRCLWASTSTKNPEYRDVMYVEELIGPETVNTMPLETIRAFQEHGAVRGDTVLEGIDEAHDLLRQLAEAGVDYDDVTDTLEEEGVQKFADSFEQIV